MPLAEKPITSCQAMNLSPNIRPRWLLSGCGGNDDSASTSASCLCVVTGLQGCMSAGGAVEWLPHLCKKLPRGEMGTAAVRLPINSVQLGIERMSAFFGGHAFQCRCGMKCCDQFWDIVALFFFFRPAASKGGLSSFSPYRVPRHDSRASFAFVISFSAIQCILELCSFIP